MDHYFEMVGVLRWKNQLTFFPCMVTCVHAFKIHIEKKGYLLWSCLFLVFVSHLYPQAM